MPQACSVPYSGAEGERSRIKEQDMRGRSRSLGTQGLWVALIVAAGSILLPATAEAQARGTVQVYAQVVDTKVSCDGLQAAKAAVKREQNAVSTVANVNLTYPTEPRAAVVVTIDYSKN